ncbi:unnamed protein product [Closterium sp. NIES-54]
MTTLRVLLHVAAQRDYELHSLDFSTAFLQGSLHEEIWLRRPPGFTGSFPPGTQWSLQRPVYSLRQVPHLGELHSYLGLQITRDRARRTITLTQSHMVQLVLQRFGFTWSSAQATPLATAHSLSAPPLDESVEPSGPYPELVGCLMYMMTCTRPDLAYPLGLLARYVAPGGHRKVHMDAAKRVLCYLCSTSGMGLVLGGRGDVVLTGHSDASWVDDQATKRSSQGYTFNLGSGSVSWRSTCSSSVLGSSCEAEIYATAMAAQELRWLTYLLTDLGERPRSPPVLLRGDVVIHPELALHFLPGLPKRIVNNEPGPGLSPHWGDAEDCPYDESVTGAEDDVEWWAADGLPEDLPVPSFPPPNKKRPHPSKQNRDARPPSPRSKPSTHKRNSYTSQEKLQWIAKLESGAVSVRRMSRDTGISRKSLSEWKSRKGELEGAHGACKCLHGRGRVSWYRDMEIEVYSRVLAHRKKCLAVSVGRLQKWSHEVMKILHPDVKWAGSQRLTERFRQRWNLTTRANTRIGQKLSSGESVFVLSLSFMAAYDLRNSNFLLLFVTPTLPLQSVRHRCRTFGSSCDTPADTERTVEEVGICSVPIRSDGYQKERVTVMLACTTSGEKLKPWVFFKRKTIHKGNFPSDKPSSLCSDDLNIVPAVIPVGCTSEIQPLDVVVNRSFKAAVRQLYQEWFESEGVDCLTERGELNPYVYDVSALDYFHPVLIAVCNIRKPPPELTLKWISKAWKALPKELIRRSFLTCGISNALDGSQDNLCMQHSRDAVKGEVELDDEIVADGFCCNTVEEPESDGEADQDGSATVDGDA